MNPDSEVQPAPVDVVIVGAGFTGLAAALELAGQGRSVRVLERDPTVGGRAASFDVGDQRLERFYHHWFSSDNEMIALCETLGICPCCSPCAASGTKLAPIALRFSPQAIIIVSCAGMTLCLFAAAVPALAPYAYAGVGLFIAPIFPTALPWLMEAAPRARRAGALVIAASMVGGVAAGPALGKVIEWAGIRAVPLLLAVVSLLCLAATLWLISATRTSPAPAAEGLAKR